MNKVKTYYSKFFQQKQQKRYECKHLINFTTHLSFFIKGHITTS